MRLLCLTLISWALTACKNQVGEDRTDNVPPSLVSLTLVQSTVPGLDSSVTLRPIDLQPEFNPETLRYEAWVSASMVTCFPIPKEPALGVLLTYQGSNIAESGRYEGAPFYRFGASGGGTVTVVVLDSVTRGSRTYSIVLHEKPQFDPASPALKALLLQQVFAFRYVTYSNKAMTPEFHPDSLEYRVEETKGGALRLLAVPESSGSEMNVTFNGSLLTGSVISSDTAAYVVTIDSSSRIEANIKDQASGKNRTYSLSIRLKPPVNTGDWVQLTDLPEGILLVDFANAKVGYLLGVKHIFKTTDSAGHWVQFLLSTPEVAPYEMIFPSPDTGYLGDGSSVLRTVNGGRNWGPLDLPAQTWSAPFAFPTSRVGYLIHGEQVFRTADAGVSWIEKPTGIVDSPDPNGGITQYRWNAIRFLSASLGFVAGNYGKVYRTRDSGQTWENISGLLDTTQHWDKLFALDDTTLFVGNSTRIYGTRDGGRSWSPIRVTGQYSIRDFVFINRDIGYAAGVGTATGSSLLRTADGGRTWETEYFGEENFGRLKVVRDGNIYAFGNNGFYRRRAD